MRNLLFIFSFIFSLAVHGIALYFTHGPTSQLQRSFKVAIAPFVEKNESKSQVANKGVSTQSKKTASKKLINASDHENGLTQKYLNELIKIVESHKFYPSLSQRLGEAGEARVRFTVDSSGKLLSVSLESASGFDRLDQAAISAVKSAGLFPRFPSGLKQKKLDLALSLKYISE